MCQPILRIPLRVQPSSLNSPLEVIENWHNLTQKLSFPSPSSSLNLRSHPLPIILEISLGPLGQVQILVPLPLCVRQQRLEISLDLIRRISRG